MLKDITFGQYFPGNSAIHKMDGRFKIVLDMVFMIMLFTAKNFQALGIACSFAVFALILTKLNVTLVAKSIKPVLPLILFTAVLNLFFIKGNTVLWHFWKITIYSESIETTAFMIIRIVVLIVGMSLLTYTTSPITLTDSIESLLNPLKRLKFPVHELAMMMTIALRFIPTLIEETDKIISAQKARGANFDTGGIMQRAKALVPILIPLFISAFKRANELAVAMECRCYRGGVGRTRLKQLKFGSVDIAAVFVTTLFFAGVIATNIILGKSDFL
jgi:energy-coupling factor transport system permease protein